MQRCPGWAVFEKIENAFPRKISARKSRSLLKAQATRQPIFLYSTRIREQIPQRQFSITSVRVGDITNFTLPTAGIGTEGGGQSVVYVDWDELENVQERFKNDDLPDYEPTPY